jgi:3-oxoacyl-[acyl-carrier-protein] synthase II
MTEARNRVAITGVGVVSAVSDDATALHGALCRGESAVGPITLFEREFSRGARGAEIKDFDGQRFLGDINLRPLDRTGRLAVCGAKMALEASGWTPEMRDAVEVDLVVGTMFCCARTNTAFDRAALVTGPKHIKPLDFANTVINSATGQTAIWHRLRGASMTVCAGTTSGLHALQYAARRVALGWSDAVLVGGVEELCFETWFGFAQSGHLLPIGDDAGPRPFSRGRKGFLPGEGSGFLMLENAAAAAARGARVLGEVAGWGSSYDPTRGSSGNGGIAAGARAMTGALAQAGISAAEIGCLGLSGNGSPAGDRDQACALGEVIGPRLSSVPAFALAGALGETFGASGLLHAITLLESGKSRVVPPTRTGETADASLPALALSANPIDASFLHGLLLAHSFDGSTAAIVLKVNA